MTKKLDTTAIRAQMKAMDGHTTGPWHVNGPKKMEIVGRIHRVMDEDNYPAAFVPAWDQPDAGQIDGTDEAIANARLIAAAPDMRATILALCDAWDDLRAENERLRGDRDEGAKDYCTLMDQRDALAVHVKKLELALRPFVEYVHDDFRRGKATYELVATDRAGGGLIGAEDLRRARAALAQKGGE